MPITAKDLVSSVSELISLPETVLRVNQMVDDPQSSAADIGEVIQQDPGLAARLLRVANSPFYGFPSRIDNVPLAVAIIGTNELRDLILATSAIQTFSDFQNDIFSLNTFWEHSLRCAIIARSLASNLHEVNIEHYFTAGLLHDIGNLIIYREMPELAKQTLTHNNKNIAHIIEQEIIGFDHAQVGGELLRQWMLPSSLSETVEFHHSPRFAKQHPKEAAIIHIANYLANTQIDGDIETNEALEVTALKTAGLNPDILQAVLKETNSQLSEILDIMVYDDAA